MGVINNFITDLMDEMVKMGASDLMLRPDSVPYFMVKNSLHKGKTIIDIDELIEDLAALDINVNGPENFYYFHHTENEFAHKMRGNVDYEGTSNRPVICLWYIKTILKTELEEEGSQ